MVGTPDTYRENAARCLKMAAEATDPAVKTNLTENAERWFRLAVDSADANDKIEKSMVQLRKADRKGRSRRMPRSNASKTRVV